MKKHSKVLFILSGALFLVFIVYTILLTKIDVKNIGANASPVGFSTLNEKAHDFFGVHMTLYTITDWAGCAGIFLPFGFAVLGLTEWIKRKSIRKVDTEILLLGGFYLLVIAAYIFFEYKVINYRPVLIEGRAESSYPSSTTLLILCVMPTAMGEFSRLIRKRGIKMAVESVLVAFTAVMVIGRLVSGVHWLTDILGGVLLSASLVSLYFASVASAQKLKQKT